MRADTRFVVQHEADVRLDGRLAAPKEILGCRTRFGLEMRWQEWQG